MFNPQKPNFIREKKDRVYLGDDEQTLGESFNSELGLSGNGVLEGHKIVVGGNFESTGSWDNRLIGVSIFNSSKSVSDGFLLKI